MAMFHCYVSSPEDKSNEKPQVIKDGHFSLPLVLLYLSPNLENWQFDSLLKQNRPFGDFEDFLMGSGECWITYKNHNDAQVPQWRVLSPTAVSDSWEFWEFEGTWDPQNKAAKICNLQCGAPVR